MENEEKEIKSQKPDVKNLNNKEKSFSDSLLNSIIKIKPYIVTLKKHWKKLLTINFIVLIITLGYLLFLTKPYYKSSITILPNYGNKTSDMGQLSGLAAMSGLSIGKTDPMDIYNDLVTSESVLSDVIYAKYQTKEFSKPVNLIEYFELKPDKNLPEDLQKRKMFLTLSQSLSKGRVVTDMDRMTKILKITVEMPESKLSADVANNLAVSLDKYVRTQRKSYAVEQRIYLEARTKQVMDTLTLSEERLKNYREQNRIIGQSAQLQLDQARITRSVEIQQTIYGELRKELELVKLEEIRDSPVLNVREPANEPIIKAGPKRAQILIIILFFSFVISSIFIASENNISEFGKRVKKIVKSKESDA